MTYEEFLNHAKSIYPLMEKKGEEYSLYEEWCIGGQTGGSCWDTGDPEYRPIYGEAEPEFRGLFPILEVLAPNITLKQFAKILPECEIRDLKSDLSYYYYYGNYDTYTKKILPLRKLYQVLIDNEVELKYPVETEE